MGSTRLAGSACLAQAPPPASPLPKFREICFKIYRSVNQREILEKSAGVRGWILTEYSERFAGTKLATPNAIEFVRFFVTVVLCGAPSDGRTGRRPSSIPERKFREICRRSPRTRPILGGKISRKSTALSQNLPRRNLPVP